MQIHKPENITYMKAFHRYEPVIMDSTAMSAYKFCPRFYFYTMVLGFQPKEIEPYFFFGAAYHKFREELSRMFMDFNASPGEAYSAALNAAIEHYNRNKAPIDPKSKFAHLTLEKLKESCLVAFKTVLEEQKKGAIKTIGYEQPFVLVMDDGTYIAGRLDEPINWRDELWVRDFKTSSKNTPWYSRSLDPNDQFTRYTWALSKLQGKPAKGVYVEALFVEAKKDPVIEPFLARRTPGQLDEWERGHMFWMKLINQSREEDNYPMNEKSCAFCKFHQVCKAPTESGRMSELKSKYKVRPWDCTTVND